MKTRKIISSVIARFVFEPKRSSISTVIPTERTREWRDPFPKAISPLRFASVEMTEPSRADTRYRLPRRILLAMTMFFTFLFLLFPWPVMATETGLSIYPPILEAVIKPGKIVTQVFDIQNISFSKKTLVAKIIPFEPSDSGFPILRPDLTPKWLSFFTFANSFVSPNVPFTLEPNAKSQIVLSINIPNNIPLQDIYATLLISTEKEDGPEENITSLTSIASNILLSVSDKEYPQTSLKIETFEVNPKNILFRYKQYFFVDNLDKISFLATAKNTGTHYTKIGGLFRISQGGLPIHLQGLIPLNILSDSSRQVAASPSGEINFQPQANLMGNFLAELDIKNSNSSAHSELNLIILPFKIFLGLIASLILLYFIYTKSK